MYIRFDLKSVEIEKLSCLSIQRFLGWQGKNLIAADSNKCAKASSTQKFGIFCIILCVSFLRVVMVVCTSIVHTA